MLLLDQTTSYAMSIMPYIMLQHYSLRSGSDWKYKIQEM